ncbi:unnamed protein product, partial [Owenia fusiformis]
MYSVYYVLVQRKFHVIVILMCIGILGINFIDFQDTPVKQYRNPAFNRSFRFRNVTLKIEEIRQGLVNIQEAPVRQYKDPAFNWSFSFRNVTPKFEEIRQGLVNIQETPVKQYRNPAFNWSFSFRNVIPKFEEIQDLVNITIKEANETSCTELNIDNELTNEETKAIKAIGSKYETFLKKYETKNRKRQVPADINITEILFRSSAFQRRSARKVCADRVDKMCGRVVENLELNPREKIILPFENFFKPFSELKHAHVFYDLRNKLKSFRDRMVYSIGITYHYLPSLINWIIVARQLCIPPIGRILVYSQDIEVCEFLDNRKINVSCLYYNIDELRK